MVLTHLILNGMIKVKGQLGEMAKCVEDPETRITDLAKLFFKELSGKDNAIYNNLPDSTLCFTSFSLAIICKFFVYLVISHLSTGDHAVEEEKFESILKYIFTFIEKVGFYIINGARSLIVRLVGETSRKHRREALSTIQTHGGS
jgi:condensin complex subunit 1